MTLSPSEFRRGSKSRRICDAIRDQIIAGVYRPGASLTSSRSLGAELGVSRSTVTVAYEQLVAEGYLEAKQGRLPRVSTSLRLPLWQFQATGNTAKTALRLSNYGKQVSFWPLPPKQKKHPIADFRYGDIRAEDFPLQAWRQALTTVIHRKQERFIYGDPKGNLELRKALQGYLWRARGVRCDAEQIIVVNGSQQGLDLCARLLLNPGDKVVHEEPGYLLATRTFLAIGAKCIPIGVDRGGMQTSALNRVKDARLVYVTPSHQFPLGGVLTAGRRRELLTWSAKSHAYVLEDDYDSEFRFDTRPMETLHSLDETGCVIYLGTVSKTLSMQLRLGYLVVPQQLSSTFTAMKRLMDRHTPSFEQIALTNFISTGAYERHIRRVRRRNGERREELLQCLRTQLCDEVEVVGSAAGLHVVLWFNYVAREREAALINAAESAGIGIYPVSDLYFRDSNRAKEPRAGIIMGYAALTRGQIHLGIAKLRKVVIALAGY